MIRLTRRSVIGGLAAIPAAARAGSVERALFLGNSFLKEHDVPGQVGVIASAAGCGLEIAARLAGGASMTLHAAEPELAGDLARLRPDWIVLQDHSTEPLTGAGRDRSAKAVAEILAATAARPVFVATWPREAGHALYDETGMPSGPAGMAETVESHCVDMAAAHGGILAPVGRAWIAALENDQDLHRSDGYHANPKGAWLTALVIAGAMGRDLSKATPPMDTSEATPLMKAAMDALHSA
ncbi:MAG: hypothetical protein AAGF44_10705 [Pseudomonadota bacterium]